MKHALVSGCSSGIGRAVTDALLADGWAVLGVSRTRPLLDHDQFSWRWCDVSQPGSVARLREALDRWTSLDALVHAAAMPGPVGRVGAVDARDWKRALDVNLYGTYLVVDAALPALHRAEDGRILLFSGGGAFGPRPRYTAYAAAKAGVVALMEALAEELAGSTVTVNCVAPGPVRTRMQTATLVAGRAAAGAAAWAEAARLTQEPSDEPMQRAVACVRHLLSPGARWLTGKTVSAVHDAWPAIAPETVPTLNRSRAGTRDRHRITMLDAGSGYLYQTAPDGLAGPRLLREQTAS